MADISTLPVSTTKEIKSKPPAWKLPGAMFQIEEDFEKIKGKEEPATGVSLLGSISFNTVKEVGGAAVELTRWITGIGVETTAPIVQTEKPIYVEGNTQITEAQIAQAEVENERRMQAIREEFNRQLRDGETLELRRQKANEAFRLTGTEGVSLEQAREMGHLDNEAVSTLIDVARAQEDAKNEVVEQEQDASVAETNQPVVNLNSVTEGGTGGGKANISQTGGGG